MQGEMVQFAAGTTSNQVGTRAGEAREGTNITPGATYYMPDAHRFVCRMYYIASADTAVKDFDVANGTDITTWMKVSGTMGNSLYWNRAYEVPTQYDSYGNDDSATCFYWQNRRPHAFLAWTDLNHATTIVGTDAKGSNGLKFEPADVSLGEIRANAFNLTRAPRPDSHGAEQTIERITDQPDICQALTIQSPLGATQSANRVNLYFKHQFSQIQVNIKGSADLSVVLSKDDIQKVELLGITDTAYVFTQINAQGELPTTTYKTVDISQFPDSELQRNPYGTSFEMFDMLDSEAGADKNWGYPTGYLKAYNAIAFGQLQAIRITWKEASTSILHEATYVVSDENLKNLRSGYKYIWNIELRRGTLAIIRTEISDWIVPASELEYKTDGTIDN